MSDFVRELTGGSPEVAVIGASRGPAGQLIRRMFLEAKRSLHMITDDFEAAGGSSDDTGMPFIQWFRDFHGCLCVWRVFLPLYIAGKGCMELVLTAESLWTRIQLEVIFQKNSVCFIRYIS